VAQPLRAAVNARPVLWALLAVPAVYLVYSFRAQDLWPEDMVGPTGEWAARMIIVALMLTPLSMLLPRVALIRWLVARRRAFGVAAFLYTCLHLAFYLAEMETLDYILAEIFALGIWTGWLAFLLMIPLASTSNDASMRALRGGWKRLQRLAYPVALLTLVHWIAVHNSPVEALVQFAPLALLQAYRLVRMAAPRSKTQNSLA
jgi:sulfoxide reductase heme-binding subunit YedZ